MPIVVDEQAVAAPATVATQVQVSAKASASQAAAFKVGSSKGPEKPQVLKVKVEEMPTAAPEPQARVSNHVICGKCPRFLVSLGKTSTELNKGFRVQRRYAKEIVFHVHVE